jgi:type II secretory pathway pseudopilin PulG
VPTQNLSNGHPAGPRRGGFTLAAVIVTVMIIAALAAVALPVVQGADDIDAAQRTAAMLISLDSSLTSNNANVLLKGVCNSTAHCPLFVSSLTNPIASGDPTCKAGTNYGNPDVTNWLKGAPFSGYPIIGGKGFKTPLGWVHDTLIKLANNSFELHIDSLTADQANYLDLAIDGSATPTTLKLRYAEQPAIFAATGQHRYLARYIPTPTGRINC